MVALWQSTAAMVIFQWKNHLEMGDFPLAYLITRECELTARLQQFLTAGDDMVKDSHDIPIIIIFSH